MTAKHMWNLFRNRSGIETKDYDAWAFGDEPDKLAKLVLDGKKCATASVYELYEYDGERLPEAGTYSVVLDSNDQAVCVIRDTEVKVVPFRDVDPEHAYLEGEGDRSLEHWREVHEKLFREWLAEAEKTFSEDTKVVLERFEVVFSGQEPDSQPR